MPKFILIDQSLRDLGGHHYPYAQSVLAAAERAGWQPVLAVHRSFAQRAALPAQWRVHGLYAHESYSRHTLDTQARLTDTASGAGTWVRGAHRRWGQFLRRRRAAHFARDCARLAALEQLGRGDLVFLATVSELDLWGLARFLHESAPGADCDWHLQFHFGVYYGREPDYDAQAPAARAMRDSLAGALRLAGARRLHLHCTTEQLTIQYLRLGVAPFTTLAYPVHELFRPRARAMDAPLRIACLGHSRREKGYGELPPLLRELWRDWFGPGRAQLVLQTHHGRQRRSLEAVVRTLSGGSGTAALDFAPFPLPLAGYAELLCGADVGLMLYDPTRYYARCSGVLLEMLCAGVPVLVPAGSWLAAQIEGTNQRYLDTIAECCGGFTTLAANGELELPHGASTLLLTGQWRSDALPGEFLRLQCELKDGAGATLARVQAVLGARDDARPVRCLLRLPGGCARVHVVAGNAWRHAPPPAGDFSWTALANPAPMGALGLTIAAPGEIPRLLRDVLEHAAHYRRCAREQATECARLHSGRQVLADLAAPGGADVAGDGPTT